MPESPSEDHISHELMLSFHARLLDRILEKLNLGDAKSAQITHQAMQGAIEEVKERLDPEDMDKLRGLVENLEDEELELDG